MQDMALVKEQPVLLGQRRSRGDLKQRTMRVS